MITLVYYDYDGGGLHYEQFETDAEAQEWLEGHDYKALVIEGAAHTVFDHT